ncbi:hypothetical protein HELRODRAFT_68163 [Helobdella robusta]|uniref:ubiquitinyl hydrolase 1 n=1 Tax=Helobdella robusta TaxID=6412 RepID=T1FZB1_HELRO|nr:hypothetical protein HELRODRAFT_68163 [Helobdella robusta]ESN96632.1 hypothetical protein HELRODRAFT_68163 [Helobdella robusta]
MSSGLRISQPQQNPSIASTSKQQQQQQQQDSGDEDKGGFNSEDECQGPSSSNQIEKEKEFEMMLKEKRGYIIKRMGEDGACLFRAVADQVYGDQEMHSIVRQNCVDYMAKNGDFFKQFVTEDFTSYLNRKRLDSCHGNNIEMQALCELYNRPIEVYQMSLEPINTFHATYETDNEPIRLSYHNNVHYNSVVDPYKATIGVGLGLPGFQPGLADKNLVRDAVRQSEDCHIEQTMLEDKLRETDWELTQETIEEQVARESYLQYIKDQNLFASAKASPRATCSSTNDPTNLQQPQKHQQQHLHMWWENNSAASNSPTSILDTPKRFLKKSSEHGDSPKREDSQSPKSPLYQCSSSSTQQNAAATKNSGNSHNDDGVGAVGGVFDETASLMNELPPQLFGLSEWDEEDTMLARVIAESQQQYLNDLKMAAEASGHLIRHHHLHPSYRLHPHQHRRHHLHFHHHPLIKVKVL